MTKVFRTTYDMCYSVPCGEFHKHLGGAEPPPEILGGGGGDTNVRFLPMTATYVHVFN